MLIYEVNLALNQEIESEYLAWLKGHIERMLQIPGFTRANLYQEKGNEAKSGVSRWVVQYSVENEMLLDLYLNTQAPEMRAEGVRLFGEKFSATRRILEVKG